MSKPDPVERGLVTGPRLIRCCKGTYPEWLRNMTIYDYIMTMTDVKIAQLKAKLSEHLRRVRRGHTLTILDRETPVARIVPYDVPGPLRVREPPAGGSELRQVPLPPPLAIELEIVDVLLEERQGQR